MRRRKKLKSQVFSNGFEVHRVKDSVNPQATQAKPGKKVTVRYKGTLKNGKVFDETKGNKTFQFRLGALPSSLTARYGCFVATCRARVHAYRTHSR